MNLSGPRRAATVFVFITVTLDMLALGVIIPVLPTLVEGFLGGDTAQASRMLGIFSTVWAAMQFLFSPVMGALSDRFGRRPVILISNFGLGFDYVLMALAPNLSWLFVGRVISGITAASVTTASAYIADTSPPEKRASAYGMLGAAFGVGFVVGPLIGAVAGQFGGPRLPFWVAGVLSLLNAMWGLFVLPESLPKDKRERFSFKRANPVGSLVLLSRKPQLLGLASVNFLYMLAHVVLPSVFVLYAQYRYGWQTLGVGLTLVAVGVSSIVVQALLIKPAVERFGERTLLVAGLLFGVASFAIYGLAPTGALFCVGIPFGALWGFSGAAAQSLMTRYVGPTEQGQLQGARSSINGIAEMIAPTMFTFVFATAIAKDSPYHVPGAPFLLAAAILVLCAVVAAYVTRPSAMPAITEQSGAAQPVSTQ